MNPFFSNAFHRPGETQFKVPPLPTRFRKQNYNNCTSNTFNPSSATMNSEGSNNAIDKLYEQIDVLRRIFPPDDKIWQDIVNTVYQLCYVKIRDQCYPFSSQGSIFNGEPGVGTNVHSQNIVDSLRNRSNCTQSTINPANHLRQPANEIRQPAFYSRPDSLIDKSSEEEQEVERRINTERRKRSNIRSNPKRAAKPNSSNKTRPPPPPIVDYDDEADAEMEDDNSIISGLFVPTVTKLRESTTSEKSTIRQPCKPKNTKIKDTVLKSVVPDEPHDLRILPSEDDSSMISFLPRRKKVQTKSTLAATNTKTADKENTLNCRRMSVSLTRLPNTSEDTKRRKRRSRSSSVNSDTKRRCSETTPQKPDSTQGPSKGIEKQINPIAVKKTSAAASRKREAVSSTKPQNAEPKVQKKGTNKKSEKNQILPVNPKMPIDNKSGFEELPDSDVSFFGNVSSIDGLGCSMAELAKKKNDRRGNDGNDDNLHFFSQFEDIRCTSGYSAISTPLSKSTAKNTLGKRLKKPSVVAELKDDLKKPRKPRKAMSQKDLKPLNETAATTESECEASSFSDNCD